MSMGSKRTFVREQSFSSRRCVVKTFILRNHDSSWIPRRLNHTRYLQREGVSQDGAEGTLYGPDESVVNTQDFLQRGLEDRHEFRFILSPEDSESLDLTGFTKGLVCCLEKDWETKLDWIASNHYNTEDPHVHLVVRGVDEHGDVLILDRDTISHGIRNRAREIITRDLGERTELEIRRERQPSVAWKKTAEWEVDRSGWVTYDPDVHGSEALSGVLCHRGISDELTDREFLLIRSAQNKYYYVDLDYAQHSKMPALSEGDRISIETPLSLGKDLAIEIPKRENDIKRSLKLG